MEFSDERYAAYKLQQCNKDQQAFNGPLTILSLAAAAIVLVLRIRNQEYRRFPDSIFTMSLVQATLMHWFTCAAVWTVISVIVVLYMIAVRQVPIQLLVKHSKMVYASLVLIPSATVAACWIFGGYEPFPGLDNCWIHAGIDRFIYFHTFTILGLGVSAVLGPITVRSLWRAYCDASGQSDYARIFRIMLIRQVLLALYGSIMFFAFLLGGVNTLFLKINPEAHKTWYIKQTAYTYCMLSAVNFSTLGIFVSIIFFSTKTKGRELVQATRRLCSRICPGKDRACNSTRNVHGAMWVESGSKHELNIFTSSRHLTSPRSPGGQLLFPSAFDSAGQTALSVPPDPRARNAQQLAATVYTSTLLEYAREQLLDESFVSKSSNSSSCSSFSSHDNDKRCGSLDEWVSETEDASSFSSSLSPRAAATPYLLHDGINTRSEVLSTYYSHVIDARRDQEHKSYTTEL